MNKLIKEESTNTFTANQMAESFVLEKTKLNIMAMLEKLPVGLYVSASQLVPNEQWLKMGVGERSRFGLRLSLLVSVGELPLNKAAPVGVTNHYLTT